MAGSECVEYRALSLTQNQVDRKWPFRGCCKSGVWIRDIEAKQQLAKYLNIDFCSLQ